MIDRPIKPLTLLYIFQGSFFKRLFVPCLLLFLFSSSVYYYQTHIADYRVPLNASVFTLLGIALAIFHGFCNNAAYDRFWEGRKQWGNLVWHTRNFARQVLTLNHIPESQRQALVRHIIAFPHALRYQLRFTDSTPVLERILTPQERAPLLGRPFTCLLLNQHMGETIAQWRDQGDIDTIIWQRLDHSTSELAHVQAACERISNTPIPFAYFVLLHRTVYLYCFLLPFGLGNTIGWVTPIMATFVGYTFMALNEIVDEISEPFGTHENDLPLTMMSDTIETQLALLSEQSFAPEQRDPVAKNVVL